MSERSEQLTNEAITQFLRARSADPDASVLDDVLRTVVETPQERSWLALPRVALPRRMVLIVAMALLLATMSAIAVGSGILRPNPLVTAFGGTWVSTSDADGGMQTMNVEVSADAAVEIVVHDTIATVCGNAPSTMTGAGAIEQASRIVIPQPVYTCDDGTAPQVSSGTPLDEQLRDLTMTLNPQSGFLTDSLGAVWYREGVALPSLDPVLPPAVSGQWWPQTSLDAVRAAQERADAGDTDYAWQVAPALVGGAEPWGAEILKRFLTDALGWEAFREANGYAYGEGGGLYAELTFYRCALGRTNPLYPDDPNGRGCAPTIDDFRYETVMLTIEQPVRGGPDGIWVVTEWQMLESSEPRSLYDHLNSDIGRQLVQVAPLTDAEAATLLEAFLGARVDGEGAERYILREPEGPPFEDEEVPLLYATTEGASYERYETQRLQGPEWPTGSMEYKVRLFAGDTVVEQYLHVVRQDGGEPGLIYGYGSEPTTENGQAVPIPYSLLEGELTFSAAPPWDVWKQDPRTVSLDRFEIGSASQFTSFVVAADLAAASGCEAGQAPSDADAFVQSLRANPELEVTAPVAASVGGIDALQMDVVALGEPEPGDCVVVSPETRMRVYVLALPEGMSAPFLVIRITAHESLFDQVVEAAMPVLDSFEFHGP